MSDRKFYAVLAVVLLVCIALTAVSVVYTAYLHEHCSIIGYIANER